MYFCTFSLPMHFSYYSLTIIIVNFIIFILYLERSLITDAEVAGCKNGFNTWAYIGDINNKPQLNCVFQSDDAQNEFLSNPKVRN